MATAWISSASRRPRSFIIASPVGATPGKDLALPADAENARHALESKLGEYQGEYEAMVSAGPDDPSMQAAFQKAYAVDPSEIDAMDLNLDPTRPAVKTGKRALELVLNTPYSRFLVPLLISRWENRAAVDAGYSALERIRRRLRDEIRGDDAAVAMYTGEAIMNERVPSAVSREAAEEIEEAVAIYNNMPSIGPFPPRWASNPDRRTYTEPMETVSAPPASMRVQTPGTRRVPASVGGRRSRRKRRRPIRPRRLSCLQKTKRRTRRRKKARARGKALSRRARRRCTSR